MAVVSRTSTLAPPRRMRHDPNTPRRECRMEKTERRAQILARARDVFARQGYHATSVADIIDDIRERVGLSKKDIAEIVESVFDIIKETAQREGKIVISGFGVFATKNKRARRGRNPQTGSDLQISPRRIVTFKPSPVLKASVNGATGEIEADQKTDEIG